MYIQMQSLVVISREVPTLARLYSDLGFTFKETLNSHIRSLGKDPQKLWNDIEDVIRQVFNFLINLSISSYSKKKAVFFKAKAVV